MKLRDPKLEDYKWVHECYQDWPIEKGGPFTEEKCAGFVKRWVIRKDPICRVLQDAEPLGFITYRRNMFGCVVENLIIRPKYRGHGASTKLIKMLRDELVQDGIVVAEFKTLPGVIRNQIGKRYQDIGDHKGRLVWDMEI